LEAYTHAVLREVHLDWKYESFDGVWPEVAKNLGEREAEFTGLFILISDQTLTPFHIRLKIAENQHEIEIFDCKVGELRDGKMVRIPYNSVAGKKSVHTRLNSMTWKYHVGFGTTDAKG
jgi:hypothetical protein